MGVRKLEKSLVMVGDFETTVYQGQTHTEVWASALVPVNTEDVLIFHSIDETWEYLSHLKKNVVVYYHNLKFDGMFWLSYFFDKLHYEHAYIGMEDFIEDYKGTGDIRYPSAVEDKNMHEKSVKYLISDMGQWYMITVRINGHFIEFRDSYKLLPFSVRAIGKSFKTKHQKLDMEYEGYRYAGCEITEKEKEYIANDVLVVKEGLEFMFNEGHNKLTIGSCCMEEFRKTQEMYKFFYPNVYNDALDVEKYDAASVGEYVHKAYRGAWTYLVEGKEKVLYKKGLTADVNSLYPSMMHSESGNYYPIGHGHMWKGNKIPYNLFPKNVYYYVRIRTRFYLKEGMLPFIQIKRSGLYSPTKMLKTSDVEIVKGKSLKFYKDKDGKIHDTRVTMTLTMTDFALLLEHYDLVDFEILDGCWFEAEKGIFDRYIDKWKKIKMNSTGAMRQLAKLFLNNLYGKMATSTNSSFKLAVVLDDGALGFLNVMEFAKKPGYIPIGAAITSYARNFTIRAAQKNYHGLDKPGFIYADTDSIHCDLSPDELIGVPVHPTEFCHWKIESCWDEGWFVRAKTYIEHVTHEDCEPIENPFYNIKCAGMPERCKKLFMASMSCAELKDRTKYSEKELEFADTPRTIEDFREGLEVPGKLMPKRINGGIILVSTDYKLRFIG